MKAYVPPGQQLGGVGAGRAGVRYLEVLVVPSDLVDVRQGTAVIRALVSGQALLGLELSRGDGWMNEWMDE